MGFTYQKDRGPFWLGTNFDPAYTYLLNSLRLAGLQPPKHVDHPGTTVHSVGAVLLRLVHTALRTGEGLEDDHIRSGPPGRAVAAGGSLDMGLD